KPLPSLTVQSSSSVPLPFPLPWPLPLPLPATTQRAQPEIFSTVRSTPAAQLPDAGRTFVRTAPGFQYAISFAWVGSRTSKTRKPAFEKLQASIFALLGLSATHLSSL